MDFDLYSLKLGFSVTQTSHLKDKMIFFLFLQKKEVLLFSTLSHFCSVNENVEQQLQSRSDVGEHQRKTFFLARYAKIFARRGRQHHVPFKTVS
jgi:hypothetical protein